MRRLLVGVDGSPESLLAAHYAANLAHSGGGRVTLVCALPSFNDGVAPEPRMPGNLGEATQMLNAVAEREARANTVIETATAIGRPADVLARLAGDDDVDFIAVGHRKRGPMARALFGSVADELMQIAPKPVLVVS
jgi:nucleotide-binding universal stress UspA family protein